MRIRILLVPEVLEKMSTPSTCLKHLSHVRSINQHVLLGFGKYHQVTKSNYSLAEKGKLILNYPSPPHFFLTLPREKKRARIQEVLRRS